METLWVIVMNYRKIISVCCDHPVVKKCDDNDDRIQAPPWLWSITPAMACTVV